MSVQYQTAYDIEDHMDEQAVAVLPVGAVEAHGPHLPLGTDNILAEELATRYAEKVGGYVFPTLSYGQVWSLQNFTGSISISNETLISMIVDIGKSVYQQGFGIFSLVNGHLGNQTALKEAARKLYEVCPEMKVFYFFYPGMNQAASEVRETPSSHGTYFHACEIETSLMLYLAEDYVDMQKAIKDIPHIEMEADFTPTPWEEFTETAVLGDATLATKEKGEHIITTALENMVNMTKAAKREKQD